MMTHDEALTLFRGNDLVSIGFQADAMRKRLHPEPVISYSVASETDRIAILELTAQSTLEDRLHQLAELRKQQQSTQQFVCFAVISAGNGEVTASDYLKTLAIARLYLENIPHAQAPVRAMDSKLAQVALRFGANDLGVVEVESGGKKKVVSEEQVRHLIRDAGLVPKQRDSSFQTYFLY